MKLVHLILLFCIAAVQILGYRQNSNRLKRNDPYNDFDKKAENIFDSSILDSTLRANSNINMMYKTFANLIQQFGQNITTLNINIFSDIDTIRRNADYYIVKSTIAENQMKVISCQEEYHHELNQPTKDGKHEANECVASIRSKLTGVSDEVNTNIDAMSKQIYDLVDISKACIRELRPTLIFKCLAKSISNIKDGFNSIKRDGEVTLRVAALLLKHISDETEECLDISLQHTKEKVDVVSDKIIECIKNKPDFTSNSTLALEGVFDISDLIEPEVLSDPEVLNTETKNVSIDENTELPIEDEYTDQTEFPDEENEAEGITELPDVNSEDEEVLPEGLNENTEQEMELSPEQSEDLAEGDEVLDIPPTEDSAGTPQNENKQLSVLSLQQLDALLTMVEHLQLLKENNKPVPRAQIKKLKKIQKNL